MAGTSQVRRLAQKVIIDARKKFELTLIKTK